MVIKTETTLQQHARRSAWLRTLHQWHWISAALSLIGLILFSVTGITLNHASAISATLEVRNQKLPVAAELLEALTPLAETAEAGQGLPTTIHDWARQELEINLTGKSVEWDPEEVYVSLPEPGGDAWLRIDLVTGEAEYERTTRGWISYFNDLHKGRNTGPVWQAFIDLIAVSCLVFALTGLLIMKLHAAHRPHTWPVVGFGLVLPMLLALLFIH